MRCTNCNAHIPRGLTSCPNCGVYALDEPPKPPAPPRRLLWPLITVLAVVLAGVGGWWWWSQQRKPATTKPKPLPVHVVRDRPGGNVEEAEAVRMLRSTIAERRGIANDCIAIISHGKHGGVFELTAVSSCDHTRLGNWRVDATTHEVRMR